MHNLFDIVFLVAFAIGMLVLIHDIVHWHDAD